MPSYVPSISCLYPGAQYNVYTSCTYLLADTQKSRHGRAARHMLCAFKCSNFKVRCHQAAPQGGGGSCPGTLSWAYKSFAIPTWLFRGLPEPARPGELQRNAQCTFMLCLHFCCLCWFGWLEGQDGSLAGLDSMRIYDAKAAWATQMSKRLSLVQSLYYGGSHGKVVLCCTRAHCVLLGMIWLKTPAHLSLPGMQLLSPWQPPWSQPTLVKGPSRRMWFQVHHEQLFLDTIKLGMIQAAFVEFPAAELLHCCVDGKAALQKLCCYGWVHLPKAPATRIACLRCALGGLFKVRTGWAV